jgi:hypothetical protein
MRLLLPMFLAVLLVSPAQATPFFQLSWDSCTGPLNRCIAPGEGDVGLYGWVIGQDAPHTGYDFRVDVYRQHGGLFPDAWRFDVPGCQGASFIQMRYTSPAALSKTCPTFERVDQSIHITDYGFDALTGHCRIVMASAYPAGSLATDPAVRYMLGQILFNFTYAVAGPGDPGNTCGNVEAPMELHLTRAAWVDMATGNEHDFATGRLTLVANDPLVGCAPVPARATTWGAIRGQYR